jgi:hypothetical protein
MNPAEAEDIRAELHVHLAELIEDFRCEGMSRREAVRAALQEFGDIEEIRGWLDRVHQGDPWWVLRLKGFALGAAIGTALGLLTTWAGGHSDFLTRHLPVLPGIVNSMLVGGAIGLAASGGRGASIGWALGSLVWLAQSLALWAGGIAAHGTPPEGPLALLSLVFLSPFLGGIFGLAVGLGTAAGLLWLSGARVEVR